MAERQGDAPAIVFNGQSDLSYMQLLRRARCTAARLNQLGVGRESVVGLGIEKSPDYVASLLAIWFAGAAFVPLDPQLPQARLQFMARQSGAKLIVVRTTGESPLDDLGIETFTANSVEEAMPSQSTPAPQDLAYIIFTSGSTGQPKGVMVEHRGIVNVLEAQISAFRMGPRSRALFHLSTSFDASVSDIGTALLSGAALHIESPESLSPGAPLGAIMARRGITHADLPPSLLQAMTPSQMPECLQTVVIGGEACPPPVVRQWAARFRIVNVYGPTEATVCSSLCVCDPESYQQALIGRPLPNVVYRIIDADLTEVPAGTPGELFIGGIGLARGYVGRPDLTASRFVVRHGERLYRTGDRVVRNSDGEIQFLGRLDRQVKLRGLLIEPEEIEQRLTQHPGVRHAAVVKRRLSRQDAARGAPAREGLVAFIVPNCAGFPRDTPSHADLSRFLGQSLARWMLPQIYEVRDQLPVLQSGKVDYAALRDCELLRGQRPAAATESLSDEGRMLADIWKHVLGVESVSADQDFFELGGDSLALLAATAATEARGLRVPPSLLAERWTLAMIAAWLKGPTATPPGARSVRELEKDIEPTAEWIALLQVARNRPQSREVSTRTAKLLLTGATGFLGSRLLAELLRRTDAQIYCLLRPRDSQSETDRLRAALAGHEAEILSADARRISIVHGDLSKPHLGLSAADWEHLASQLDAVYHCAASVNIVQPYEELRAVNVLGTREILRLVCTGSRKQLHYASTLSVFVATDRNGGVLAESDDLSRTRYVFGGYAQSKWAAERLLRAAAGDAGPISIYRFGLITGDSRTGYSLPRDHLAMFVRGIVKVGCVPARGAERLRIDITPVDYAAAAMAYLSQQTAGDVTPTWHLANAQSLSLDSLVDAINACGATVAKVADDHWHKHFEQRFAVGRDSHSTMPEAAAAYLSLCRSMRAGCDGSAAFDRYRTMDLFQATGVEFSMDATRSALVASGLSCPVPDQTLLRTYVGRILNMPSNVCQER